MKSDKVKDLYNDRASTYERVFVDFLGWGKELNAFFRRAEPIHPRFRVLDAGCGTGIVTRTLYQLALEKHYEGVLFHAFDLTQGMLDIFQTWVANQGATNIELRQADVLDLQSLPSDWKNYDLVITSAMLEYLPRSDVAAALVNLKQLLKHEGTLLIFITRRNFLTQWLAAKWWKTNLYVRAKSRRYCMAAVLTTLSSRTSRDGGRARSSLSKQKGESRVNLDSLFPKSKQ